ncbi:MAG: class I SAM-dependent methyltransferase [Acidobacteria bacterium]|nr:class I SAM-dependent methyltransferase [Acidobacteriota bacterium]
MNINEQKLHALLGKVVSDFGAVFQAPLILIGDSLGLYRAMRDGQPTTPAALAERTGTTERYLREWLNAHAAAGFVDYHPDHGTYSLSPEQAMLFADEGGPAFIVGAFQVATGAGAIRPALEKAFRTGEGLPWQQHDHQVFHGTERFFRSGYVANLVPNWIPSIAGAREALSRGARVADIGCGHGASTLLMAQAFPNSRFFGFDSHPASVASAQERAAAQGLSHRVHFAVAHAKDFPGTGYDLVTIFDALHDLGDPAGAAAHVRSTLQPEGAWMIVEPYADDRLEANFNAIGRAYFSASTLLCTPCSLSQEVGLALGAQAGEARLRALVTGSGFGQFRRTAQTPFHLVFEARI